jgi:toxin FitB
LNGYLLDTNVISELIRPAPEPRVVKWTASVDEDLLFLSVLTFGEIRQGVSALAPGGRRTRLEQWLHAELTLRFANRLVAIDLAIAETWGRLAAAARSKGTPLPVIDGLLAASALRHDLVFVTRDTKHAVSVGVTTLNPWQA